MEYHPSFWAEVFGPEGPTGEAVFIDSAILVDSGNNKLAGPFKNPARALARQKKFRVCTSFVGLNPYRIKGHAPLPSPDLPSVPCQPVLEWEIKAVTLKEALTKGP